VIQLSERRQPQLPQELGRNGFARSRQTRSHADRPAAGRERSSN